MPFEPGDELRHGGVYRCCACGYDNVLTDPATLRVPWCPGCAAESRWDLVEKLPLIEDPPDEPDIEAPTGHAGTATRGVP